MVGPEDLGGLFQHKLFHDFVELGINAQLAQILNLELTHFLSLLMSNKTSQRRALDLPDLEHLKVYVLREYEVLEWEGNFGKAWNSMIC